MPYPPIIALAAIMCGSAVLITAMVSAVWYVSRRRVVSNSVVSADLTQRLERIERIVESTSIEVERLGEANRFVTKLLTERSALERG